MIACPGCGAESYVVETRTTKVYARRSRRCSDRSCDRRFSTIETIVETGRGRKMRPLRDVVFVPRQDLEKISAMVARLLPSANAAELSPIVAPAPEVSEPKCPGPDCSMCSGEACNLCGAGCWNGAATHCVHAVDERHQQPAGSCGCESEPHTCNEDGP